MKKFSLLCLLLVFAINASADAVEIDGIYYNLISKAIKIAEVTSIPVQNIDPDEYNGPYTYSGSVEIPKSVIYEGNEYSVTSIGESAFKNCSSLTSITIPNSMTSIGDGAFSGCYGLSAVHISDLAAWCKINFQTNTGNTEANPLFFAHHLFLNGTEIEELVIPNSVKSINDWAFYGGSFFTSVFISNGVTSIGRGAFLNCSCLTSVSIPNSVTNIGYECFYGCNKLSSAMIGDNNANVAATVIGGRAFYQCSGLESVLIGNNVKQIERDAFNGCINLTSATIPNSVTDLGSHVFVGCTGLTSVELPESITSIKWATFAGCTSLESITIPNSVETIGESAFERCTSLASINLPDKLTYIDYLTFSNCSSLTSISIPDKVTTIQLGAFEKCKNLSDVTLGRGIKDLYQGAFSSCSQLSNVYCYAKDAPACHSDYSGYYGKGVGVFDKSLIEYATLYVPESAIAQYQNTAPWSNFNEYKTMAVDIVDNNKCATPTINYDNDKIVFNCETEGVELHYSIKYPDVQNGVSGSVNIKKTCIVSVYATKTGYSNSDVATKEIQISASGEGSGKRGDLNNDGVVNSADAVTLVNIIMNNQ